MYFSLTRDIHLLHWKLIQVEAMNNLKQINVLVPIFFLKKWFLEIKSINLVI